MKENLAFQKPTSLCDLQAKYQVDLGPNYRNPTACETFVSAIVDTERNEIRNKLQGVRFFSVLADGSTDSGIIEQESFCEIHWTKDMSMQQVVMQKVSG